MRVKSPLGDFPLAVNRICIAKGAFTVEAAMGAWPTDISVRWRDLPRLAAVLFWPLIAAMLIFMAMGAGGWALLQRFLS